MNVSVPVVVLLIACILCETALCLAHLLSSDVLSATVGGLIGSLVPLTPHAVRRIAASFHPPPLPPPPPDDKR